MNAKDLIKEVETIEIPKCNMHPITKLDVSDAMSIDPNYREKHKEMYYDFSIGDYKYCPYYNSPEGTYEIKIFDAFSLLRNKSQHNIFFKYLDKYDAVAVCLTKTSTDIFEKGEKREPNIIDYYFITKDKYFVYKTNGKWKLSKDEDILSKELPFSIYEDSLFEDNVKNEFGKLFGIFKNNNEHITINSVSDILYYIVRDKKSKVDIEKTTKKLATLADKTLALELPKLNCKLTDRKKANYYVHADNCAKLEYVNADTSVIRWFRYLPNGLNLEYMRFYATTDGNFLCELDNDNKFHVITKNINKEEMRIIQLFFDKKELSDSKFKYFLDMLDTIDESNKASGLYEIFRFNLLEKFSKTGLDKLVNKSINNYYRSRILPYTTIGKKFSVKINPKETDIYKALGLNKHQYKKLIPYANNNSYSDESISCMLSAIRILFNGNSTAPINDIDNATFDKFLDKISNIVGHNFYYGNFVDFIRNAKSVYSLDAIENGLKILECSNKSNEYRIKMTLFDYVKMVSKLNDSKSFPLKVSTYNNSTTVYEEIKNMHDAAVEVYNLMSEKIKSE